MISSQSRNGQLAVTFFGTTVLESLMDIVLECLTRACVWPGVPDDSQDEVVQVNRQMKVGLARLHTHTQTAISLSCALATLRAQLIMHTLPQAELKTLKVHLNVLKEQLQEKTEALREYQREGTNRLNESFECEL